MKKNSRLSLITLFLLCCFFFVPQTMHALTLPTITWSVNGSLDASVYNPGDTITLSGSISSTLCSNSMNPINVNYTSFNNSCAAKVCGASTPNIGFPNVPPLGNSWAADVYQHLDDFWNTLGAPQSGCISNMGSASCPPADITAFNPNNNTVMTLTGGGNTLEWQNKVTIPPNTPCGVYSIRLNWVQPVYPKGGGEPGSVQGTKVITIRVGQTGTCGSANNVASTLSPSASTLCSSGKASNVFSIGNSWKWTCDTFDKCGTDTQCSAPKANVAGVCGTNAQPNPKTYPAGSTSFKGTFCENNVTPIPASPLFPSASSTPTPYSTTWTCPGSPSVNCTATTSSGC